MEGAGLRVEAGGWMVEGGGWRVEGGGWRQPSRQHSGQYPRHEFFENTTDFPRPFPSVTDKFGPIRSGLHAGELWLTCARSRSRHVF